MKYTQIHSKRPTDINQHLVPLYNMVLEMKAKTVIELGVRSGESTVALLEGVHQTEGHLWSVDVDPCLMTQEMVKVYGMLPRWRFVQGDDIEFAAKWDKAVPVDIVFVDTSHQYEHTKKEIVAFEPLVRPGGRLIFHDTTTHAHGVLDPINEFLKEHPNYAFRNYPHNSGLGVVLKP